MSNVNKKTRGSFNTLLAILVWLFALPAFATGGAIVQSSVSAYCGGQYTAPVKFASITAPAGDTTIVSAVTGKKIRVLSFVVSSDTNSGLISFESGTGGTALTGDMEMNAGVVLYANCGSVGCFETASGALLNVEAATAGFHGHLTYVECE